MRAPIGIKIRNRRKTLALSQAGLARAAGISPSYLNLIEGNKRDVGGTLLIRIADQLGLQLDDLTGEKEQRLLQDLQELLPDPLLAGLDLDPAHPREMLAQFPAMAAAMNRLHRAYLDANLTVEAYANRLQSDPLLSQLLHKILSQVTAIRSGAEILKTVSDLSPAEHARFVESIGREATSLTDGARMLIEYFEQSMTTRSSVSPAREVDDLIIEENCHFPELEDAAETLRASIETEGAISEATLTEMLRQRFSVHAEVNAPYRSNEGFPARYGFDAARKVIWFHNAASAATRQFQLAQLLAELSLPDLIARHASDRRLTSAAAQRLAFRSMASYVAGAIIMPYSRFLRDAETHRYDIDLLKRIYAASFEQVAHRLVTLRRPGEQGIPFGFLRSDPAGRLTKHFPLPGLPLPSSGHACPLWAIYGAFRNGDRIIRQIVSFADDERYLFVARTVTKGQSAYHEEASYSSVMLACDIRHADRTVYGRGLNFTDPSLAVPVGPTCRLCIRRDCMHRQEEALDPANGNATIRLPLVPRDFTLGNVN